MVVSFGHLATVQFDTFHAHFMAEELTKRIGIIPLHGDYTLRHSLMNMISCYLVSARRYLKKYEIVH